VSTDPSTDHSRTAAKVQPLAQWRDRAACAGQSVAMATHQTDGPAVSAAKAVCWGCPVLEECREWVLALPEPLDPGGVCGGMTEARRSTTRRAATANRPRVCSECRVRKTRADFATAPTSVSGLASECKGCAARRKARAASRG
jgi:WhiB family redox-sensing transcriptional regulator